MNHENQIHNDTILEKPASSKSKTRSFFVSFLKVAAFDREGRNLAMLRILKEPGMGWDGIGGSAKMHLVLFYIFRE